MKGQEIASVTATSKGKFKGSSYSNVKIEGLDELCEAFAKLGEDAIYKLSEPSVRAAKLVCARATSKIHDVTGALGLSLTVKNPGKQKNKKAYKIFASVTFGKGGAHGVPLELGHRLVVNGKKVGTVKERPFLRPAADESKEEVIGIMADAMNKVLDEMGGMR
ncbi:MAG: hypothetical protein M0R74_03300 [Dehalococcoidia bacterium]|nr:hypothetical protein [Dehalococcoidia bacterium]